MVAVFESFWGFIRIYFVSARDELIDTGYISDTKSCTELSAPPPSTYFTVRQYGPQTQRTLRKLPQTYRTSLG